MSKSSKGKVRMLATMMLLVSLVMSMGVTAYAADIDNTKTGFLTIQPRYGTTNVSGGTFNMYLVATISATNPLTYQLVAPFDQSGVDINGVKKASDIIDATALLTAYIPSVAPGDVVTATGGVEVDNLQLGIYLVVNTAIAANYTTASPFLAFLPLYEDGGWIYGYDAYPKVGYVAPGGGGGGGGGGGTPGQPNITVAGPTLATVDGETTPAGAPTIPAAPAIPSVTIDDGETPAGSATIPDETVTIDPDEVPLSAPQTGMLQWPVPVLGTLGLLLAGSGLMVGREKKENE